MLEEGSRKQIMNVGNMFTVVGTSEPYYSKVSWLETKKMDKQKADVDGARGSNKL